MVRLSLQGLATKSVKDHQREVFIEKRTREKRARVLATMLLTHREDLLIEEVWTRGC